MSQNQLRRVEEVPMLAPRKRDAHKGQMGHILIIGGSRGLLGAPALAAAAALRSGAGLVTLAVPQSIHLAAAALCPCATSLPLPCDDQGDLAAAAVPAAMARADAADVLAVGPGLSQGNPQRMLVQAVLEQAKPVVIDADGLNNLAQIDDWPRRRHCPLILTPHPGEMSRLCGRPTRQIQADRQAIAAEMIATWSAAGQDAAGPLVLVLKGAGTIVTEGKHLFLNDTGNPGMATGGTGDILTGVIAALLGQGLPAFDAAVLGVHVHGLAGDLAAEDLGEISLIASDLSDYLPDAFGELMGQE
jgi:ADP-dependent NAD(P)H-hydrate dehydratase